MAKRKVDLHALIWEAALKVGHSPPRIADEIIGEAFPETTASAKKEGGSTMFRQGFIAFIRPILRGPGEPTTQTDFSEIDEAWLPLVRPLRSGSYYVETANEYVTVSGLIAKPKLLNEARSYMRRKGKECLDEANRLDQLYLAITSSPPPRPKAKKRRAAPSRKTEQQRKAA